MRNKYQRKERKSIHKLEEVKGQELLVRVPLPMAEVWAEAQVQHFCSPTGNCSLWFFRRTAHGYRLLLDTTGQGFTVQKTAANGFRDLVIDMHSSATDQWLKVYRYDGRRYGLVGCYDADLPASFTPDRERASGKALALIRTYASNSGKCPSMKIRIRRRNDA